MSDGKCYPCPMCRGKLIMEACGCMTCENCDYIEHPTSACEGRKPLAEAHCRLLKEAIGKPLSTIVGCLFDGPSQAESIAVHFIIWEEAAQ